MTQAPATLHQVHLTSHRFLCKHINELRSPVVRLRVRQASLRTHCTKRSIKDNEDFTWLILELRKCTIGDGGFAAQYGKDALSLTSILLSQHQVGAGTTCTETFSSRKASAGPSQEPESGEAFSCSRATATEICSLPTGLLLVGSKPRHPAPGK